MKLKTYRRTGAFTLVEIMIVVAIIGLLAAIAIPNFVRAREQAQTNGCINNLRQIDGAIQQWALENNAAPDATVTKADIAPYLKQGTNTKCPASGPDGTLDSSYSVTTVQDNPTCQIVPDKHVLPN